MHSLISVVMAVFNGNLYTDAAILSILNQTYKNFEFIIIDDGSEPCIKELTMRYNDSRIRYYRNKLNMGLTHSLNKGIRLAKGKYIARMDSDDVSMPDRLEKQLAFLEKNRSVKLLGTFVRKIDENGLIIKDVKFPCNDKQIRRLIWHSNQFAHPSVMFDKDAIVKVGLYDEQYSVAQDYDLWFRVIQRWNVANLDEYLLKYRQSRFSITRRKVKLQSKAHLAILSDQIQLNNKPRLYNVFKTLPLIKYYLPSALINGIRHLIRLKYRYIKKFRKD